MKATTPERTHSLFALFPPFLVVAVLTMALNECRSVFSGAKAQASNITCAHDFGIVNGEMDAGVNVKVTVTNVGAEGFINIRPELSTSEGEWSRSQNLQFRKGETKSLSYFFHEPTIGATNIQCRVGVTPKAD
jgi:hypothetical protein